VRQIDDKIAADDVTCLLALRGAIVRHAPLAAVPMESALRPGGFGYVRDTGITEAGLAFLEQYFLFCHATGCDGALRQWDFSPGGGSSSGCAVEANRAGGYYIKCRKCGSINLLEGTKLPVRREDFRIKSVIPAG
jgi:hypothetical protein